MEWSKRILENFKQAAKEVFSLTTVNMSENHDKDDENNQRKTSLKLDGENTELSVPSNEGVSIKEITKNIIEKPAAYMHNRYPESSVKVKNETTFITELTKIQGNIITESNIAIAGEIQGDIESKNHVITSGKVVGDIKCKSAEINGANIEGNITVPEVLMVGKDSIIVGDISANNGKINGKIKGNVIVRFDVEIHKNAFIIGDISANSISVEKGAIIQGGLKILSEEAEF